jgi:hypothetical protein
MQTGIPQFIFNKPSLKFVDNFISFCSSVNISFINFPSSVNCGSSYNFINLTTIDNNK